MLKPYTPQTLNSAKTTETERLMQEECAGLDELLEVLGFSVDYEGGLDVCSQYRIMFWGVCIYMYLYIKYSDQKKEP